MDEIYEPTPGPRRRVVRPRGLQPAYIPLPDGDGTIMLLPVDEEPTAAAA